MKRTNNDIVLKELFNSYLTCILLCSHVLTAQGPLSIKEGTLHCEGASIYYKTMGQGEPLLILHGGPGLNHSYFLPHFITLAESHTLVFYDQRGCGLSSDNVPEESITMANYIKDIEAIRLMLGVDKISILAHSFGGVFATSYAIARPEQVRKLVLVNSVALNKAYEKEIAKLNKMRQTRQDSAERAEVLASPDFKAGKVGAYEHLFAISFRPSFYNRAYADSLYLSLEPDFAQNRKKLFHLSKDLDQFDLYPGLEKLSCQVLIIYGAEDAIPKEAYFKMAEHLKNSKLVSIPSCGHYPFIEQKRLFFQTLRDFKL